MFEYRVEEAKWFFEPDRYSIEKDRVEIITKPKTDFWQRTYYGFQNDNAHVFYITTEEKYFSFTVRVDFNYGALFDQCGIAVYQNSDNWAKACIEFNNKATSWLGSVVTNRGYSDWATTEITGDIESMWYRLSRRESDYCIENSLNGTDFKQMRIFHLFEGAQAINFGLFACSPVEASFKAVFTEMKVTECLWKAHHS